LRPAQRRALAPADSEKLDAGIASTGTKQITVTLTRTNQPGHHHAIP